MSLQELSKGDPDNISGSLPKYIIDCQSKISKDKPTTDGWLENISYIQTLKNTDPLISPDRTNKQILEGILDGNKKVVIKVSNENENIEKEFDNYKILINNNVQGFLNYYCYFICKDLLTRIREDLTDTKNDYRRIINIPNFSKKTKSICRKHGNDMKVLIMEYVENGSFGLYNWKSTDIEIIKSCVKQLVCTLVDAYIKTGFVHFDLNNNNYVLKKTKKTELIYNIKDKEIKIGIPINGFETAIMDLEDCEIEQNTEKFIQSLDKLFNRIKEIYTINDIWKSYSTKINDLLNNLYKISDKKTNIELAMRVLEIIDLL